MFPPLPELLLLYTLELWVLYQRCCNVEEKCCVEPTSTSIIDDYDVNTVKLYVNYLEKYMCWKIRKSLKSFKSPPYATFIRVSRERRGVKRKFTGIPVLVFIPSEQTLSTSTVKHAEECQQAMSPKCGVTPSACHARPSHYDKAEPKV